jgi:hypothetical protein
MHAVAMDGNVPATTASNDGNPDEKNNYSILVPLYDDDEQQAALSVNDDDDDDDDDDGAEKDESNSRLHAPPAPLSLRTVATLAAFIVFTCVALVSRKLALNSFGTEYVFFRQQLGEFLCRLHCTPEALSRTLKSKVGYNIFSESLTCIGI